MQLKYIFLLISMAVSSVMAEMTLETTGPVKTCGTPQISADDAFISLEEMKTHQPERYQLLLQEAEQMRLFNIQNISQRMFWGYNFVTRQYYSLSATLRKSGNLTRIWVEDASWNNSYVNESILNELMANLENYSGAGSIDPNRGIIEIDTLLFGQPPNYDGDGIIDFLILDIRDSFDPNSSNSAFIAGYFSPTDQTTLPNSNRMDLMYLDSYPGIFYQNVYTTGRVLSTTAHEIQHLIHHNYDQDESLWVNEGLSELAGTYCGYGLDFPQLYLEDTNHSLTGWGGEVADYARANLWTLYCAEQLGLNFIKNLVQHPQNGETGFNQTLALLGLPGNLASVYRTWVLANLINDPGVDLRYGYQFPEAQGVKVSITKLISAFPAVTTGTVQDYGVEYHRFRGQDSLEVSFINYLPENFLVISRDLNYDIKTIPEMVFTAPSFSEDSTYLMVLYSTAGTAPYRYNSFAKYSLHYYELAYDDNQTDINLSFQNVPALLANRFIVPESNLELENVSFWSGSGDYPARIRIYDNRSSNLPGSDLISPLDVTVTAEDAWMRVDLPVPLANLQKDQVIYAGIEIDQAGRSVGYDDQIRPGNSYLNLANGGWRPLSDFQINSQPLTGVWMIRVVLSGLVISDSTGPEIPVEAIVLNKNFPNPFSSFQMGTRVAYQVMNPGTIHLLVYNTLGQKVAEATESADGEIFWNGHGSYGPLAAGIYFYRLVFYDGITGGKFLSGYKKMVILN